MLHMDDIITFNFVDSFSTGDFTANFPHFLASEQLMFHTFASSSAHFVDTRGYTHGSIGGGSQLMHYAGRGAEGRPN